MPMWPSVTYCTARMVYGILRTRGQHQFPIAKYIQKQVVIALDSDKIFCTSHNLKFKIIDIYIYIFIYVIIYYYYLFIIYYYYLFILIYLFIHLFYLFMYLFLEFLFLFIFFILYTILNGFQTYVIVTALSFHPYNDGCCYHLSV